MALMSGKTYSNTGTPSNADGVDGDIFMQLDGLKTTYRKEGGVWTAFGNQLGTIPEFLKGIGVPSNSLGADNQYYRDVNTDAIYEKSAGVWTNIGSWTSLAISNLLESNGIGADLATTNHVSNIDTFIEAGAEGYFDSATTGTKPHTYGVVKVTKAGTELHQSSQTSTNKVATRVSGDTGTTWSVWRITANQDGDATRKFKALAGTDSDDVAVVSQLPSAGGLIQAGSTIRAVFEQVTGVTLSSTSADIIFATISCTAGEAIRLRVTAKIPFILNGGSFPQVTFTLSNVTGGADLDSSYHWDKDMGGSGMTGISTLQTELIVITAGTTIQFKVRGIASDAGVAGPTWGGILVSYCTLLVEVIKT